jgi:peptidoglycan/LPS O-acetylase OafA/YrhL
MRYFWGLDLIRFASAVMVVLFHFSAFGGVMPAWPVEPEVAPIGWLEPFAWMGWIGVQIFFVLSGFVIAASAQTSSSLVFLKKRAIRLLPALWISACIALLARALWGEPLGELIPAFLKTLVLSPIGPYIDGVVWTLVVEAAFYLSVALVIALRPRGGDSTKVLNFYALMLGAASGLFNIAYWVLMYFGGPDAVASGVVPLGSFAFDVSLLRQGVYFALGMVLFQAVEYGLPKWGPVLVAWLCAMCALQIFNHLEGSISALVPIAIWLVATGLIYIAARYGDRVFSRDMQPIMRPIGLMTYPLYLNHFVIGAALTPILSNWITSPSLLFATLFSMLLLNAWVIAQYPEKWIQKHFKEWLLRPDEQRRIAKSRALT